MTRFAKKSLLLLLVVLLVAAFACSCGGEKTPAETTDPTVTDPVVTDPVVTDPVVTDPVVTDPVVTDPVVTDPVIVPEKPEVINYEDYYPLYVQDGLLYHMNFASAVESESAIGGVNAYNPFIVGAKKGVVKPIWDGFSSTLGNGYLNLKGNSNIFAGTVMDMLATVKAFSVEFVAAADEGTAAQVFIGPGLRLGVGADFSASFTAGEWGLMLKDPAAAAEGEIIEYNGSFAIKTATDATMVTTYSFAFDLSDIEETYKYTLNAYANGLPSNELPTLTSTTNKFSARGSFNLLKGGMRVYAIRVYEKELSEAEVLQNHFIDIAMQNGFDLTEFKELDDAGKLSVYKAFEYYPADEEYSFLIEEFVNALAAAK